MNLTNLALGGQPPPATGETQEQTPRSRRQQDTLGLNIFIYIPLPVGVWWGCRPRVGCRGFGASVDGSAGGRSPEHLSKLAFVGISSPGTVATGAGFPLGVKTGTLGRVALTPGQQGTRLRKISCSRDAAGGGFVLWVLAQVALEAVGQIKDGKLSDGHVLRQLGGCPERIPWQTPGRSEAADRSPRSHPAGGLVTANSPAGRRNKPVPGADPPPRSWGLR